MHLVRTRNSVCGAHAAARKADIRHRSRLGFPVEDEQDNVLRTSLLLIMKVLYYIQHKFVKVSKGETSLSVSHIMLQRECDINSKQLFIQFHPSGERQ